LANYADGKAEGAAVSQFNWAANSSTNLVAADLSSAGPVLLGDIDGDGNLDLFVGGR